MKTTLKLAVAASGASGRLGRCAPLLAVQVGASALMFIKPAFAQTDYDTGTPDPIGSTVVAGPATYGDAVPSFDEPLETTPSAAAADVLPEPTESVAPEQAQGYVPPPPVGLTEVWGHPPLPAADPQFLQPQTMPAPEAGFDGRIH